MGGNAQSEILTHTKSRHGSLWELVRLHSLAIQCKGKLDALQLCRRTSLEKTSSKTPWTRLSFQVLEGLASTKVGAGYPAASCQLVPSACKTLATNSNLNIHIKSGLLQEFPGLIHHPSCLCSFTCLAISDSVFMPKTQKETKKTKERNEFKFSRPSEKNSF